MKRISVSINPEEVLRRELLPEPVAEALRDSRLYDSSCSREARVLYIEKEGGLFLKEAPEGSLSTEAEMTAFMHRLGLAADVRYYGSAGGKDYLLTERLPGEDGIWPGYLAEPEKLCDTAAEFLRALHETAAPGCPVPDRNRTYAETVRAGIAKRYFDADHFRGLWDFSSFEEAERAAREGLPLLKRDALLHGDYCLPNIILRDWKLSGYIDLGSGGIGDRHIDILWGIWTLKRNLKTDRYTERFLDVYGRDRAEKEKLRAIAAMECVGETA